MALPPTPDGFADRVNDEAFCNEWGLVPVGVEVASGNPKRRDSELEEVAATSDGGRGA